MHTSKEDLEYPKNNILTYSVDREIAAQFAEDLLTASRLNWRSITITAEPEKSGASFVRFVIDTLLEDTVKDWVQRYYGLQQII